MQNDPLFSIITSALNAESNLVRCLRSVTAQSFQNWEMICVDDGSTDATGEIFEKWAQKDNRIRSIILKTNRGLLYSRKIGISRATGHYIIILDSDDELATDALATAYKLVQKYPESIIHCATAVVHAENSPNEFANFIKKRQPMNMTLPREKLLEHMYITKDVSYNLWGKIYPASLIKKAAEKLEDGYFFRAEDLYFSFIIADLSKSYVGVPSALLYKYYIGTGGSFANENLYSYLYYCLKRQNSIHALRRYISASQDPFLAGLESSIIQTEPTSFIKTWIEEVSPEDALSLLDTALECYTVPELSARLFRTYAKRPDIPAKVLRTAKPLRPQKGAVKNIAIIYHKIANGGVEKKISHLIPLFLQHGHQVSLITTFPQSEQDYTIPSQVMRVVIPTSLVKTFCERETVSSKLNDFLQKNNIDTIIDFRGSNPAVFFDMLVSKALGIRYVIACCEMFSQGIMGTNLYNIGPKTDVFRLADCVIVLSRADEFYWKSLGVNVQMIQNPPFLAPSENEQDLWGKHTIAWLGRLDNLQKRFQDIVPIFKHVLAQIPDAKMIVVGGENESEEKKLKKSFETSGLLDHVELLGFQKDVTPVYERCSVTLCTSLYESFGNVLLESRIHGIPVVSYDMPYLEQFADPDNGIYRVPQKDTKAAANAIVKLLKDHELYLRFAKNAKKDAARYLSFDVASAWEQMFSKLAEGTWNTMPAKDDLAAIVLQTIYFHTALTVEGYQKRQQKEKQRLESLQQEIKASRKRHQKDLKSLQQEIKASRSYQIGRAITWGPRMIRNTFRCLRQHGLSYTLKRIPIKFINLHARFFKKK